jgi:luciferase family oxidoreductase group 1
LRFSALDSAPVRLGGTGAEALAECLTRARRLDELGCHRLWFTEHHLAPDVASTSPLTLVGQAAAQTRQLRLGAGGVMIRNYAPLVAAEQVVTLSLLHPGRIDVGLGRAGGSDLTTDKLIRRTVLEYVSFPEDVAETVHYLGKLGADGVQVFILASSRETASFAGRHGLGLAVAGHIAPAGMDGAVTAYRDCFRPRSGRMGPWVVLCLPVLIADSDDEAWWWFRSVQRRYLDRLRMGGAPMRRPESAELDWSASEQYRVDRMLEAALVGSLSSVRTGLLDISRRCAPDEIMAMTDLPDAEMTMSSYVLLADLMAALPPMEPGDLSAPMDGRQVWGHPV